MRFARISLLPGLMTVGVMAFAMDYPGEKTLRLLNPALSLPENVEVLKQGSIARGEINLLLSHALPWWDDVGAALGWLPPEKAERVRTLETERLRQRRAVWRENLLGGLPKSRAIEEHADARTELLRQAAQILTQEEMAEYSLKSSPATAEVREWAGGLGLPEADILWLADAEAERRTWLSRAMSVGQGRVGEAIDHEAGELARIRAVLMILDARTAATYLKRADMEFLHWANVLSADLGLTPEQTLRLYTLRRSVRHSELQLAQDRSISKQQEKSGKKQLLVEARGKVQAFVGDASFRAYTGHELGRWLRIAAP